MDCNQSFLDEVCLCRTSSSATDAALAVGVEDCQRLVGHYADHGQVHFLPYVVVLFLLVLCGH